MCKSKNVTGFFLIVLGLIFNRQLLERLFSPYPVLVFNDRLPIWLISLTLIGSGLFLILSIHPLKKLCEYYQFIGVTILSVLLLFLLINTLLCFYFGINHLIADRKQISSWYSKPLQIIYPSFTKDQLSQLLYETWSRPYAFQRYTFFKEKPYRGKYINVNENGFRIEKNQGPWPPDPKNLNVFLFGGSTAFGYGLPDNETIGSHLQEMFSHDDTGRKACVYNFAQADYYSSVEQESFLLLLKSGFIPDIAIFVDGLNDFLFDDDKVFYDELLAGLLKKEIFLSDLPIIEGIKRLKGKYFRLIGREKTVPAQQELKAEVANRVVNRYITNKKIIESIARSFSIKTLFVWQPISTYNYDLKYHLFADDLDELMFTKDGYLSMKKFVRSMNLRNDFLWLADMQENLKAPLYVDRVHYTAEMSRKIAERIYEFLIVGNLAKDKQKS